MSQRTTQKEALRAQFDRIMDTFRNGTAPAALAQVLLDRKPDTGFPSDTYSLGNRIILALHGESIAAGFKAWKRYDRSVVKGQKAIYIVKPLRYQPKDANGNPDPDREVEIRGFTAQAVFGLSQTEGEPVVAVQPEFLRELPLRQVAEAWDVRVVLQPFGGRALGSTDCQNLITLSTANASTWVHELVHVADTRTNGNVAGIIENDSSAKREAVAELGGAILLACLGDEEAADLGGCLDYLRAQTREKSPKAAMALAQSVMARTLKAVAAILDAADDYVDLATENTRKQLPLF